MESQEACIRRTKAESAAKYLTEILAELPPLILTQIANTVFSDTPIAVFDWTHEIISDEANVEPVVCGCLMTNGYHQKHPKIRFSGGYNEPHIAENLGAYYGTPLDSELMGLVAEGFDDWAGRAVIHQLGRPIKSGDRDFNYLSGDSELRAQLRIILNNAQIAQEGN